MRAKHWKRTFLLVLFESGLIYLCGLAASFIRFGADANDELIGKEGWLKLIVALAVVQSAFYLFDLYDFGMIRRLSILGLRLIQALGLAAMVLAALFYALPFMLLGRGVVFVHFLLMLTAMTGWRLIARWWLRSPLFAEKVMILGTDSHAVELARELLQRREAGYEIIGFIGNDPALVGKSLINPCVVGVMDDLESLVRHHNADRVIVALPDRGDTFPLDPLLNVKWREEVTVDDWAPFYESLTGKVSAEQLELSQLIFSDTRSLRSYRRLRRMADVVIATIGLFITSPLMLLTAILIKLESKGPVFYSQERVGLHDCPFRIIKFRSMRTDAEKNGAAVWASKNDPRVTRIGRFIRKTRIDELPQFINVMRGEMGIVGPRPERPQFVEQLAQQIPHYSQRHLVKPGITGWAQVRYPYGASVEDARMKHQYDLYYLKNQSLLLDAVVLFETLRVVLFGRFGR